MVSTLTHRFYLVLMALACAISVGCASTSKQEGTGEYIDDSVITAKVKYAFAEDPDLKASEINVETFKGRVQLSGFVKNPAHVTKAGEAARKVNGVKSVANDIRVK